MKLIDTLLRWGVRWTWYFRWTGDKTVILKYPTRNDFYLSVYTPFKKAADELGIEWHLVAAQASLESGWGNSTLTTHDNNYFGITAGSWIAKGKPVVNYPTWEDSSKPPEYWKDHHWDSPGDIQKVAALGLAGSRVLVKRWFRKYGSIEECVTDWAQIIRNYYPKALAAARRGDVQNYFGELKRGGYASDPRYVGLLLLRYNDVQREAVV